MAARCAGGILKLTKATVLPSDPDHQKNGTVPQASLHGRNEQYHECLEQPDMEVKHIQTRVGKLREKLAEANTNICTLKAFVDQTVGQVTNGLVQKDSKGVICELKQLLVSLEDILDQNDVITQRGVDCMQMVEKLDNFSCLCCPATPSVQSIRGKLKEIAREKEIIDLAIQQNKNDTLQGKVSKSTEPDFIHTPNVATGIQIRCCPECKPKILQTEQKYIISEGTSPTVMHSFSKGLGVNMECRCKRKQ
ncbi:uncharacterized protein LOC116163470 [Photinus pyralis]|uniref:uncharacterized protein LOC116163470 n=1 Tax=Photinus pyralis TaxID=7054 RepID=UPI001267444E|nr:uncharacterized protein LOC116163470 [Photinus pyralis]